MSTTATSSTGDMDELHIDRHKGHSHDEWNETIPAVAEWVRFDDKFLSTVKISDHSRLTDPTCDGKPNQVCASSPLFLLEGRLLRPLDLYQVSAHLQQYLIGTVFEPPCTPFTNAFFSRSFFDRKHQLHKPHPCIYFTLLTIGCDLIANAKSTLSNTIKCNLIGDEDSLALERRFYIAALAHLNRSIGANDRSIDAIWTTQILGKWSYSRGNLKEGRGLLLQGFFLLIACKIHEIEIAGGNDLLKLKDDPILQNLLGHIPRPADVDELLRLFWSTWIHIRGTSYCRAEVDCIFRDKDIRIPVDWKTPTSDVVYSTFFLKDIYTLSLSPERQLPESNSTNLCCVTHLICRAQHLLVHGVKRTRACAFNPHQFIPKSHAAESYSDINQAVNGLLARLVPRYQVFLREHNYRAMTEISFITACLFATKLWLNPPWSSDVEGITDALYSCIRLGDILETWIAVSADPSYPAQERGVSRCFMIMPYSRQIWQDSLDYLREIRESSAPFHPRFQDLDTTMSLRLGKLGISSKQRSRWSFLGSTAC